MKECLVNESFQLFHCLRDDISHILKVANLLFNYIQYLLIKNIILTMTLIGKK